ncbi:MAG: MBL fold metallo-hydrolase [Planctomycetota bacterium]|nr:MBL fold metallo-hydrolase [Planctomycetota bacterium]
MPTRREFMQVMGMLSLATLTPTRLLFAQARQGGLAVKTLRDDAWFIEGGGGNCLLLKTPDGPVLCDSKVATAAIDLRDETFKLAERLPKLLVNTHHHYDHIGGNFLLAEQASVLAHRNLKPRIAPTLEGSILPALRRQAAELKQAGRADESAALGMRIGKLSVEDFAATEEIDEAHEQVFGGVKLRLFHYGPAHTDNDIVMFLPELNMLHMGDLIFHELHPYIDRAAGATTGGWQAALAEAMKLCDDETIVIPGHGELTDRSGLKGQDGYFVELRRFVNEQIKAGKGREEIVQMQVPAFEGRGFDRVQPVALGVMYDELTAG